MLKSQKFLEMSESENFGCEVGYFTSDSATLSTGVNERRLSYGYKKLSADKSLLTVAPLYQKCSIDKPWEIREASGKSSSTRPSKT